MSLYIDGVLNETNSSGLNGTYYVFTKSLSDGSHNWTYKVCDAISCLSATTRNLSLDSNAPVMKITVPIITTYFRLYNVNETLNWTVNDTALDSCWFDYNFTNTTITCSANTTSFILTNQRNITLWANDTFGNINSDYLEWEYVSTEISKTFNASSFETESETFYINITTNGTAPTNGKLIYNGTSYSATITNKIGRAHV